MIALFVEIPFGVNKNELIYVIPRQDAVVLGGSAIKGNHSLHPNPTITQNIIERSKNLMPNLSIKTIQAIEVGLRPGRSTIRLERAGNLIHNYGHGGGGFTVSWGCAAEGFDISKKGNR